MDVVEMIQMRFWTVVVDLDWVHEPVDDAEHVPLIAPLRIYVDVVLFRDARTCTYCHMCISRNLKSKYLI